MEEKIIYSVKESMPGQNNFIRINESVSVILKRIGFSVLNSTYILSEGLPKEAYGYYVLPGVGIIRTILKYKNSEYVFYVRLIGFEIEEDKYSLIKRYLEETLKRVL